MDLREVLGHRPCEALFMLFPLQQEFCPPKCLAEGVVIYCTCCSSCFPYVSLKTQQGRQWLYSPSVYRSTKTRLEWGKGLICKLNINDRLMSD